MKRLWYGVPVLIAILGGPAYGVAKPTPTPLAVLVTNDDGYNAPGIDALVEQLRLNPKLAVTVVAPFVDRSGTGDTATSLVPNDITSRQLTTLSGYPATAIYAPSSPVPVGGYPADCALFGIFQALTSPTPALIVSGINNGQNITVETVDKSGTVGAAFWAARNGIPAIALSQEYKLSPVAGDFTQAAIYGAKVVERFRKNTNGFRNQLRQKRSTGVYSGIVLNINFPTCASGGSTRGVQVVPLARMNILTGYTPVSDVGGIKTWHPVVELGSSMIGSDCTSVGNAPTTDWDALANGFIAVTPLSADPTATYKNLASFNFLKSLFTPTP